MFSWTQNLDESHLLIANLIFMLLGAVVLVPIFSRLKLGTVLPYMLTGIIVGSSGLGLLEQGHITSELAEFGIASFLFLIGLEISPKKLWKARTLVLGLGASEVLLVSLASFLLLHYLFGLSVLAAIVLGMAFSLSSTAFGMQWIYSNNILSTKHGQAGFSVLIFQDIIVVAMITLVGLMGALQTQSESVFSFADFFIGLFKAIFITALVVLFFRYIVVYIFHFIARTGINEVFMALSLLVVIGTSQVMVFAGLSMSLGAFVAGFMLSETSFKHALESHIEPFKGLLLGFFFIIAGASVNLSLLQSEFLPILGMLAILIGLKAMLLFILGLAFGLPLKNSFLYTALLGQGGEFAYIIFISAAGNQIIDAQTHEFYAAVVALSLLFSPLIVLGSQIAVEFWQNRQHKMDESIDDEFFEHDNENQHGIIIVGAGRLGSVILRMLWFSNIHPTVLENNPDQLNAMKKMGFRCCYGNASRLSVLRAAGIQNARALVLTNNNPEERLTIIKKVQEHFPHIEIFARAYDRYEAIKLLRLGVHHVQRESFLDSAELGRELLEYLGNDASEAKRIEQSFIAFDTQLVREQFSGNQDASLNGETAWDRTKRELELLAQSVQSTQDYYDKTLERGFNFVGEATKEHHAKAHRNEESQSNSENKA